MKKTFIAYSLLLIAFILQQESFAQATYDSVAAFTAKTSISLTDIFPFQTKVTNKYTWRKITGQSVWDRITDTTEARITTLLNASNSFNGINNFDGATFNAGSHGTVLFNGDSVVSTTQMITHGIQRYSASSIIGRNTAPFFNVYARTFTVINIAGTDSFVIGYSGNDKVAKITGSIQVDIDSATINNIILNQSTYSIVNVGDSIITFPDSITSLILLATPGDVKNPGISKILGSDMPVGQEITIFNISQTDTVLFKQYSAGDDNLFIAGNFYMGQNDLIVLQRVGILPGQSWIEKSRSTNINKP